MTQPAMTRVDLRVKSSPATEGQWSDVTSLWTSQAWVPAARHSVAALGALQPNWDGQGGPVPQKVVLDITNRLIKELECYDLTTAHIGPVSGGGVGIEWRCGKRDLNIEILPDGSIEFLTAEKFPSGFDPSQMVDGQISGDRLSDLRPLVRWLLGT
jgi:hypothetical protein